MPDPEKKIETWLRSFANKRRGQAGDQFQLPQATRNRLQQELRRVAATERETGSARPLWFFNWAPRLAWALPGIGLVVLLAILLSPGTGQHPMQLAQTSDSESAVKEKEALKEISDRFELRSEPMPEPEQIRRYSATRPDSALPASASQPGSFGTDALKKDERDEGNLAKERRARGMGGGLAPAAPIPRALDESLLTRQRYGESKELSPDARGNQPLADGVLGPAPQKPVTRSLNDALAVRDDVPALGLNAPAPASRPEEPPKLGEVALSSSLSLFREEPLLGHVKSTVENEVLQQRNMQRFKATNEYSNDLKLLKSFEFQQTGNEVRLIDADGSTYSGRIMPMPAADSQSILLKSVSPTPPPGAAGTPAQKIQQIQAGAAPDQNQMFHAIGTNQRLKQVVVVNGNLFTATNEPNKTKLAPNTQMFQNQGARPTRVQGKAVVGGKKEVQIEAVPVPNP